jgi:hypothetical protein
MNLKEWFKRRWRELQIGDPNSPEGLRERAKRLIEKGTPPNNPYVSVLVKQVLIKEGREDQFTKRPLTTEQIINVLEEK